MSMQLIPFSFESHEVRAFNIDGNPWFVGKDVCNVLGYANHNKALNDHCKGVTKRYPLQTPGGVQEVRIINEPDLYRVIVGSNKPEAERFERWVFEDVLPTIRQTGGYGAALQAPEPGVAALADSPYPRLHDQLNKALTLLTRPTSKLIQQVAFAQAQQLCGQLGITAMAGQSLPELTQTVKKPSVDEQVLTFLERRKKHGANIHDLSSLCWAFRKLHKIDRDALLQRLLDQGQVVMVAVNKNRSGGRCPVPIFVATQFAEMAA